MSTWPVPQSPPFTSADALDQLAQVVRLEWGSLVAALLGQFRRLDLVEDALADAVAAASQAWSRGGAPDQPRAWLLVAARRRVIDRLRSEAIHQRRMPTLILEATEREAKQEYAAGEVADDLLRLILMCSIRLSRRRQPVHCRWAWCWE